MMRVEQTGLPMGLLIDSDACRRDGMHARQRVHGFISLCPMRRMHESLLDETAQSGARAP